MSITYRKDSNHNCVSQEIFTKWTHPLTPPPVQQTAYYQPSEHLLLPILVSASSSFPKVIKILTSNTIGYFCPYLNFNKRIRAIRLTGFFAQYLLVDSPMLLFL